MTRQTLILFTILTVLTGFQDTSTTDKIIGTYTTESECCGYYSDKFVIKKDLKYVRTYSLNNFDQVGSWTINGSWTIRHDTIILIPAIVKRNKGKKCWCSNQTDGLGQMARLCNADTLILADNALWTLTGTEYKRSTKLSKQDAVNYNLYADSISNQIVSAKLFITPDSISGYQFYKQNITQIESQVANDCDITRCFKKLTDFRICYKPLLWTMAFVGVATLQDGSKRRIMAMKYADLIALKLDGVDRPFILKESVFMDYKKTAECLTK